MSVTVSKGNSVYKIQSGGTDVADVVVHGGAMIVRSDGSADETLVESGGQLTVAAGGAANGTVRYFSNDSVLDEPIAPNPLKPRQFRPSARQEAVEKRSKLLKSIERENVRNVLVRPHDHHAPRLAIDAAHGEDVIAAFEVGAEHLFVVAKSVTSLPRAAGSDGIASMASS